MAKALAKINIKAPKDRQADIQKLKGDMRGWVEESRQAAMAVNLHGPRFLLHRLRNLLPKRAVLAYYSSWWSSLYGSGVQVPPFYDAVATSKKLFEKVLDADSIDLQGKEIYPAVITGNLLIDSPVGKLFESYLIPLLPESERIKLKPFPKMSDMTAATVEILGSDPTTWSEVPRYKWVAGPGIIYDHFPSNDPILKANFLG